MISIANAPVSYGVFEMAPRDGVQPPDADRLAGWVAGAGYTGIDSGPIGMLGRGQELRDRLARHGLVLVGGWVDLPFADDDAFAAALDGYRDALAFFVEGADATAPPRPTLAVDGPPEREARPGAGVGGLDEAGWERLARNVATAVALAREVGLEPTFHHHAGTWVETAAEVDELLARTEVGLTLDTGHLLLAGGDPVAGLQRWRERVDHVHLKDVDLAALTAARDAGGDMRAVWSSGAFAALGRGDLDLRTFVQDLVRGGYDGWVVIEQDVLPGPGDDPQRFADDQTANLTVLTGLLA